MPESMPWAQQQSGGWSPRVNSLLDELTEHGVLRRVEYIRARMHSWSLTVGDPGHIDVDDPANLDPERPLYVRQDHPALPGYYARISAEGEEPAAPDNLDDLRRRARLETAEHRRETAVTNAWQSVMTAATNVRAQVRDASSGPETAPPTEPLREEEIELLARVDPAEAESARAAGGRADWTHRRPERAPEQGAIRGRGRSVDGSD